MKPITSLMFGLLHLAPSLFQIEEERENLSFEEKKKKRQEASKPILDVFWSWIEKTTAMHTTNENLTKALTYAVNQKKDLEAFLEDGRIPLSNNLCEANTKPFATARRAWLFHLFKHLRNITKDAHIIVIIRI